MTPEQRAMSDSMVNGYRRFLDIEVTPMFNGGPDEKDYHIGGFFVAYPLVSLKMIAAEPKGEVLERLTARAIKSAKGEAIINFEDDTLFVLWSVPDFLHFAKVWHDDNDVNDDGLGVGKMSLTIMHPMGGSIEEI
jgi:hypothetical protein